MELNKWNVVVVADISRRSSVRHGRGHIRVLRPDQGSIVIDRPGVLLVDGAENNVPDASGGAQESVRPRNALNQKIVVDWAFYLDHIRNHRPDAFPVYWVVEQLRIGGEAGPSGIGDLVPA